MRVRIVNNKYLYISIDHPSPSFSKSTAWEAVDTIVLNF
jgi:hypothetical protein